MALKKWRSMIEHLNDPEKIMDLRPHPPNFFSQAVGKPRNRPSCLSSMLFAKYDYFLVPSISNQTRYPP